MIINTVDGIVRRLNRKSRRVFNVVKSSNDVLEILGGNLPDKDSVYKIISLTGGIASVSFIRAVAKEETINCLTASTLRIVRKQFSYLKKMSDDGILKHACFFIGSIMKRVDTKTEKYDYYTEFVDYCRKCGWENYVMNNHSKIILMKTPQNYYVLETSSNLNENPQIEQFSFENSKELYDFYAGFFEACKKVVSE